MHAFETHLSDEVDLTRSKCHRDCDPRGTTDPSQIYIMCKSIGGVMTFDGDEGTATAETCRGVMWTIVRDEGRTLAALIAIGAAMVVSAVAP